jgi:thiamine transporter
MVTKLTHMSELALLVALALILDKLTLFTLPQGGSVTLGMLPLLLLAHRRGWRLGLLAGFLTGLLQLLFGGYFLNLWQVALDYLLAYTCLGLAGWLPTDRYPRLSHMLVADSLAIALRLGCHILAGILFYGQYAPAGTPVWLYSSLYNLSFLVPTALLNLSLLTLLYRKSPKFFLPEQK